MTPDVIILSVMALDVIGYADSMSRWEPDAAGRLAEVALKLFDEHGYEATSVVEIAEAAGLTKRTFFRHFADKREVLFGGSELFERTWVEAVSAAPPDADPMTAVRVGIDAAAALVGERHAFARQRARVIAAAPELQERELMKRQRVADAVAAVLEARGAPDPVAALAAHAGTNVFHVAFTRWVEQDAPPNLEVLVGEAFEELRRLLAEPKRPRG